MPQLGKCIDLNFLLPIRTPLSSFLSTSHSSFSSIHIDHSLSSSFSPPGTKAFLNETVTILLYPQLKSPLLSQLPVAFQHWAQWVTELRPAYRGCLAGIGRFHSSGCLQFSLLISWGVCLSVVSPCLNHQWNPAICRETHNSFLLLHPHILQLLCLIWTLQETVLQINELRVCSSW